MQYINNFVIFVNKILWEYNLLVFMLIFSAIYFTIRTRFVQIRLISQIFKNISRKKGNDGVSSVETFLLSTASRVGAGNIVGVIAAISIGGAGSIFWMWLIATLGSATAFIESILSVMYREKGSDGKFIGGTPYIFKIRLKSAKLGLLYAIFSIICYFGVTQVMSNTITESITSVYLVDNPNFKYYISIALAIFTSLVIFNKDKSKDKIVSTVNKIVPFMAILYLIIVLFIIITNIKSLPFVLFEIVKDAFTGINILGGVVGAAVMNGIRSGLFSNEAGSGNANYAASITHDSEAIKQGFVQILGVFVDTLVICSATAFIVLLSPKSNLSGMALFQEAMMYHIGFIGTPIVILLMFFFSISTILAITYYGKNAIYYITKNKYVGIFYRIGIIIMIYVGGIQKNDFVWNLPNFGLGLMTVLNIILIIYIGNDALKLLKEYEDKKKDEK